MKASIIMIAAILATSNSVAQEQSNSTPFAGPNYSITVTPDATRKMCMAIDQISNRLVLSTGGDGKFCLNGKAVYCDPPIWRDANSPHYCSTETGLPKSR